MTGQDALAGVLAKYGWVTAHEGYQMLGHKGHGGHTYGILHREGVRYIEIPMAENGRMRRLYSVEDIQKLAARNNAYAKTRAAKEDAATTTPDGQTSRNNGGKLAHKILLLEQRVSALEAFRAYLESPCPAPR